MASKGTGPSSVRDALKDIKQWDTRIQALNKEKDIQLYKKSPALFVELSQMDNKLNQDFGKDKLQAKKEVSQLSVMVNRFHNELKNVQPTPEFLEKLKVIMEDIEGSITIFKESQREKYEQLMLSEVQYSHEINALEKRFESWNNPDQRPQTTRNPLTNLASARDVTKSLPPEVAQFSKFLEETGGMRGGWDEYDHNTFLKWRVRFKAKQSFLSEAISRLPTKTAEEVTAHETWYREFLSYQEQKRLAIKAWKLKRNDEKKEALKDLSDSEDEEKEKQMERQRLVVNNERQQRVQKLGSWKLQRELERAEAEERRIQTEKEKQVKAQEERLHQEALRNKVAEYKLFKQEEEEFIRLEEHARSTQGTEEHREKLRLDKERIQLRNHFALEQKNKHLREGQRKKEEQSKREAKIKSQYAVAIPRDPDRLLRPTEGWKSRTKEVGASAESGRVYSTSHRAVPTWRKGL